MNMIRNTMLGLSLLALTGASAMAAPAVKHHVATTRVVAQAPAADAATPAPKKEKKHSKKAKDAKPEAAKEIKAEKPAEAK
jgi:hypothetical protein